MTAPNEKLASSLEKLDRVQGDRRVLRSAELSRTHTERLIRNGFLGRATKGWLYATDPEAQPGDSTRWYGCFWEFCARYCEHRFGESWHLSAEGSLLRHAGVTTIPQQAVVCSERASHHIVNLPRDTSLLHLVLSEATDRADVMIDSDGIRLLTLDAALVRASEHFFRAHAVAAVTALSQMRDHSPLLRRLLAGSHTTIAGRLAGAFRSVGRAGTADDLVRAMTSAGHRIRETCPFEQASPLHSVRAGEHPAAARIRALWDSFRSAAAAAMPQARGLPSDVAAYLADVDSRYRFDAYHSLSIEGYRVETQFIERVRRGTWNPDADPRDAPVRDLLAARGYWMAFREVRAAVAEIINGADAAAIVQDGHREWHRRLFGPSVEMGLVGIDELGGYRRHPVYLSGSRHVPMRWEAVPEAVDVLFELIDAESEPFVRAVLGHFCFAYIHPYPDGNGRLARLIMNALLASGGYRWTIVSIDDRQTYMDALEAASVRQSIHPFAQFVAAQIGTD